MRYTTPKISKTTHLWYVYFRYDGKQFRFRLNYNQIEDQKIKQIHFEELCKSILKKLREGWNPNIKERQQDKSELTIIEAFDLALKLKQEIIQNDSYINLKATVKRFKKAIEILNFEKVKILDIKIRHYEMILDKTVDTFSLTDKSFNRYKIALSNILNLLVDEKILKRNFKLRIKSKKVIKEVAHVPASNNDIELIKTHLKTNYPNFFLFWATMFHTGIRPTELLKVRLSMINLNNDCILVDKTIAKNKISRIVPINQYQRVIFEAIKLNSYPSDYFLFGSHDEKFKHKKLTDKNYSPAPYKIERKQATDLWREEIKIKLKIKMTLYSIKKHSANSFILAGASVGAIKDLFGHSSEVTTQIYITNLKEINRKEILEKGTDF